jgi:hypothetical protein
MPPYRYLFEKKKISGSRAFDALNLTGKDAPEEGYQIVPTAKARVLVEYLSSLDRSHPLSRTKSETLEAAKK